MYLDPYHMLFVALPVLVLTLLVQLFLKATYARYSKIGNQRGITGADAARRILSAAGLHDVRVERHEGFLSDHYDPRSRVVRLSPQNFETDSLAAVGVAAHEVGHALQHAQHYKPLVIRNIAVPVANIGSTMGYLALVIGMAGQIRGLALIGLIGLCAMLVFQLVNLPVEFNASKRALQILPESGILTQEETRGARAVLAAAAMTYVAAMIAILWEILYYAWRLGLIGGRSNRD